MAPENDAVIEIRWRKSKGRTYERRTGMPAPKMTAPKMKRIEQDTSVVDNDSMETREVEENRSCPTPAN